ncbi:coiled-coil domain-containing protein 181 isoform X5 [Desmodus rotundus]|uniref:coiled-coil domain-containing protein 181 isoform X5 n=1 Tax=Desmodus rotundus TaxID=9430 RepID=UPI001E1C2073|nr:coiled-coil domain-containing protein 181 isoform X5 [Desmodus rotundus]
MAGVLAALVTASFFNTRTMEGSGGTDSKETEEYEDDFEKDLEWLINEKEKSDVSIIEMACGNEEDICPELQEHETEAEHTTRLSDPGKALTDEVSPRSDFISVPSSQPLDPASDSDSENSFQESKLDSQKDLEEDEDEEVKRYIMEKIAQANKLLQTQEPVDDKRERKLKFKDKLVDLEVPPLEDTDNYTYYFESESHVSGKLSQLRISSESGRDSVLLSVTAGSCEESKDRKILVERDGKFELLNLQDIESQGCLPPIHKKELQKRLEQKREKLKREEEQRKIEEENEKKKENDAVFKAWLQKKREQVLEMRRVQRAKQLEDMSSRQENRDPQQAFRLWLKKKHEEQLRERKTEELRKQEEFLFFLKGAAGRDRAFKQWLRRKRIEKLVEQQAVKERARQLRLEAKRSRQLQNQLYNMSEAQSFRFTDYYS